MSHDKTLEVVSWDPKDHPDLPGFAHGLSRYGGHWFDISISVVPGEHDALEALDKAFERKTRRRILHGGFAGGIQHADPASTLIDQCPDTPRKCGQNMRTRWAANPRIGRR